jgi:site-specific recombinase XerC
MNRVMLVTMRMYLRFLGATGRCAAGLEGTIPAMPCWRLSALPRCLPSKQIDQLICSCDTRTLLGTRDQAIVLLLARLGLRAGDVAGLRFDDLNWQAGRVKVCGKSRREVWLPLPQDVGDAIIRYLQKRPTVWRDDLGEDVLPHVILLPDTSRTMSPVCLLALHSSCQPREAV